MIKKLWEFIGVKGRFWWKLEEFLLIANHRRRKFWKKNIKKRSKTMPKKRKQSKASRLDESLGMRRGKESTKSQSYKSRRDESKGSRKRKK